ncbi:hypothetical protein SAMN02745174_02267 [Cetobacterium ceti]|uniref:Uncharacterized protein n=1 Tax=Cetobacterium ceti TaxID=180163 RepID=A0A1T4QCT8_9FUSO|nr:hypothetical protein [Cetobacterium ceti]SKA01341.1 hypothetical protein SAMN02745174_02267 [Cetobacterium ceti]
MNIDLLTIKLVLLLFSGMISVIIFQFAVYKIEKFSISEFILYSIIFSILGYLFQFKKLLVFLNDSTSLNLDLSFILLGCVTSSIITIVIAILINKGYLYSFLNHSGKKPLVESIYLNESKYKKFLRYYANIRTSKFLYVGSIESINSKGNIVEFLISEVTVYEINPKDNTTTEFENFPTVFLALEETSFSIEFIE